MSAPRLPVTRTDGVGRPVVLLHGFTGSAESWSHLAGPLDRPLLAVTLPGHGADPVLPPRLGGSGFAWTVEALWATLAREIEGPVDLVGYSQGARVALAAAVAAPDRVRRLVLESGTPGLAAPRERAERRAADEALARRIEAEGLVAFVDRWERLPLFAGLRRLPQERRAALRARRLAGTPAGLAAALRSLGQGVQPDLWPALPGLPVPTLLLAGAEDTKYLRLAEAMAAALPRAEVRILAGCGHAPHLEHPEAWAAAVRAFLDPQESKEAP